MKYEEIITDPDIAKQIEKICLYSHPGKILGSGNCEPIYKEVQKLMDIFFKKHNMDFEVYT